MSLRYVTNRKLQMQLYLLTLFFLFSFTASDSQYFFLNYMRYTVFEVITIFLLMTWRHTLKRHTFIGSGFVQNVSGDKKVHNLEWHTLWTAPDVFNSVTKRKLVLRWHGSAWRWYSPLGVLLQFRGSKTCEASMICCRRASVTMTSTVPEVWPRRIQSSRVGWTLSRIQPVLSDGITKERMRRFTSRLEPVDQVTWHERVCHSYNQRLGWVAIASRIERVVSRSYLTSAPSRGDYNRETTHCE